MKVVCFDNSEYPHLEVGKAYEVELIFHLTDDFGGKPIDWENNYFNIKGFSTIDWFHTKYFMTIDEWRQKQLDSLL